MLLLRIEIVWTIVIEMITVIIVIARADKRGWAVGERIRGGATLAEEDERRAFWV